MAVFKQTISNIGTIGGQKRAWTQTHSRRAGQVIDMEINVSGADQPVELLKVDPDNAKTSASDFKDFSSLTIYNAGTTTAEIMFSMLQYYDNSGSDAFVATYGDFDKWAWVSWLIRPTEFLTLPNPRTVIYNTPTSAGIPSSAAYGTLIESDSLKSTSSGNTYITDSGGYFTTSDFFGMTDTGGIVPGSLYMQFYSQGYQEVGLNSSAQGKGNQTHNTTTGLAVGTAYEFRITVDDGTIAIVAFTTDGSNVNWGGTAGVLRKINAALEALFTAGSITSRAKAALIRGDLRFMSGSRRSTSAIALSAGADAGVAEFFGTGILPAVGSCESAITSALETTTTLHLNAENTSFYMIDRGNGLGRRALGGTMTIDYNEGGKLEMYNCPQNAHFKVGFLYNAAHSAKVTYHADTANVLYKVWGRSTSLKKDAQLRINGFN